MAFAAFNGALVSDNRQWFYKGPPNRWGPLVEGARDQPHYLSGERTKLYFGPVQQAKRFGGGWDELSHRGIALRDLIRQHGSYEAAERAYARQAAATRTMSETKETHDRQYVVWDATKNQWASSDGLWVWGGTQWVPTQAHLPAAVHVATKRPTVRDNPAARLVAPDNPGQCNFSTTSRAAEVARRQGGENMDTLAIGYRESDKTYCVMYRNGAIVAGPFKRKWRANRKLKALVREPAKQAEAARREAAKQVRQADKKAKALARQAAKAAEEARINAMPITLEARAKRIPNGGADYAGKMVGYAFISGLGIPSRGPGKAPTPRYCGQVLRVQGPRQREVWRCDHRHTSQTSAIRCARAEIRHL